MQASSAIGVRRNSNTQLRSRNLEVVVISKNTFDVRDLDDSSDSGDSIPHPPLPKLPSAFENSSKNNNKYVLNCNNSLNKTNSKYSLS